MKTKNTIGREPNEMSNYPSKSPLSKLNPDRREQEMKRRFGVLQSRRGYLEHELRAVKTGLRQLDQQMQSYSAYKQLSGREK